MVVLVEFSVFIEFHPFSFFFADFDYFCPSIPRCTVYEDCPEEVLAFLSQKLKRDSLRMPQTVWETLLTVSLPTKQGSTGAVSVEAGQSESSVSRETDQSAGTKGVSLEKEQGAAVSREKEPSKAGQSTAVSREPEQPKAGGPVQKGQLGAVADKPKHKISTSQVFVFVPQC